MPISPASATRDSSSCRISNGFTLAWRCCHVLLLCLGSGCATDFASSARKANLQSIYVEPRVSMLTPMRYGYRTDAYNLTMALGNMAQDGLHLRQAKRGAELMGRAGLLVPPLVHQQATNLLIQNLLPTQPQSDRAPELSLTPSPTAADGTLVLSVVQHGFDSGLSSRNQTPYLIVRGELQTKSGNPVWYRQTDFYDNDRSRLGATWELYEADPARLRLDWETQIDNVLRRLLH